MTTTSPVKTAIKIEWSIRNPFAGSLAIVLMIYVRGFGCSLTTSYVTTGFGSWMRDTNTHAHPLIDTSLQSTAVGVALFVLGIVGDNISAGMDVVLDDAAVCHRVALFCICLCTFLIHSPFLPLLELQLSRFCFVAFSFQFALLFLHGVFGELKFYVYVCGDKKRITNKII